MRYPQRRKPRKQVIAAVLLFAVGALAAAAAAHVNMSAPKRTDIELLEPGPAKAAATPKAAAARPVAPLFATAAAGRSNPLERLGLEGGGATALPAATLDQQLQSGRYQSWRFRDFAGERSSRRGSNGGSSGGGGGFSSGWGGGGGGAWGGVSGTARETNRGSGSTRSTADRSRSNGNGRSEGGNGRGQDRRRDPSTGDDHPIPPVGAGSGAGGVDGSNGKPGGPSPAGTPEPITLLLMGSGLLGLYGARKHLA
jgi:PEP-CTERM motif-containing protein